MKKLTILILCLLASFISYSNHLKGGWIYYEALGPGSAPNTVRYRITVKQYLDCHSTSQQIDPEVFLGIYSNLTERLVTNIEIERTRTDVIEKETFGPCISFAPEVCYRIDSYVTVTDLPVNTGGYTLAVQRCCRIEGIRNVPASSNIGITYTTTIPGIIEGQNFSMNNSAVFAQKDTVVICYNSEFTFDFGAVDDDGDTLLYSFCNGLTGGGPGVNQAQPNPPSEPPYEPIPYIDGYSGESPMGENVTIDPRTGLIRGIAPNALGDYVIAVCASEYRNGKKIGETKKRDTCYGC